MKKTFIASFMAAAILCMVSCSSEDSTVTDNGLVPVHINANISTTKTRMVYSEGENGQIDLKWIDNDKFSVFESTTSQTADEFTTTATAGSNGTFSGNVTSGLAIGSNIYAVFPSKNETTDPGNVNFDISGQTFYNGALNLTPCVMTAKSTYQGENTSLNFYPQMSMFKVKVTLPEGFTKNNIAYLNISSVGMTNKGSIDITQDNPTWTSTSKGPIKVTLSKSEDKTDDDRVPVTNNVLTVYAMVIPQKIQNLSVQLFDASNKSLGVGIISGIQTITKGKKYNISITLNTTTIDTDKGATESDPIQIYTAADLCALSDYYDSGSAVAGKYIKLMNDIDMSGINFRPLGANSGKEFTGNIDGNNCKITNFYTSSVGQRAGLIGRFANGSLKNITVQGRIDISSNNSSSSANYMTGGIIGELRANGGSVTLSGNLTSEVEISVNNSTDDTSTQTVGGVIGSTGAASGAQVVFTDGLVLTYGLSSEANTSNSSKTFNGINVKVGTVQSNKDLLVGGIIGNSSVGITNGASTEANVTMYNYAAKVIATAQNSSGTITTGYNAAGNVSAGGILGKLFSPDKADNVTALSTADIASEYTGSGTVNIVAGGCAGWDAAAQAITNQGTHFTINGTITANSSSSSGIVSACIGCAANISKPLSMPTSPGNYKAVTSSSTATCTATGGTARYINLEAQ